MGTWRLGDTPMNCFFHEDKPAVVSCAKCGVGLCRDCMTNAVYTYDNKPLCLNCCKSIALEELKEVQKTRTWSLVKFIFSGFFLSIGLAAFAGGADIMQIWIISGIAGIPTAFKASRRSREQRIMDEIQDRYEKDMMNLMFGWIMRLLIKLAIILALAPICALYTCISNLIKFITSKKKILKAQETVDYIEQSLNEKQCSCAEPEQALPTDSAPMLAPEQPGKADRPSTTGTMEPEEMHKQPSAAIQNPPRTPSYPQPQTAKRNNARMAGIIAGGVIIAGSIATYLCWYVPYAKDRDALRTYVVANNLFLRSSKIAGIEYNILAKIPYGTELITYSKDEAWAEIKADGITGMVASPYLLEQGDFNLLDGVWGNAETREYIESSKCRLAILDYCKRNGLNTGCDNWQLHTLPKDVKPNYVSFPRLNNGHDKFTEFAFILKNNATQERRLILYSFDDETEMPLFLYEEEAPAEGEIKNIRFIPAKNEYHVTYTGNESPAKISGKSTQKESKPAQEEYPAKEAMEKEEIAEGKSETDVTILPAAPIEDDTIYDIVEQQPEFPHGGLAGLMSYIAQNLKYPSYCLENNIEGRVIVSFVVNKDGSTTDFRIVKNADSHLNEEALRILNTMPKWKPGMQNGVPKRVRFTVPINFKLS